MWKWLMSAIQSLEFVTQSAHFFAGWAVSLSTSLLLPHIGWAKWWAPAAFVCLWAIPKELIFDRDWFGEDHESPDWLDLLFYCLGTGAACGVMLL